MTEVDTILTKSGVSRAVARETIDTDPAQSWKWLRIDVEQLSVPSHQHDAWELLYVIGGDLNVEVGGSRGILETGDTMLIDPGRAHAFSASARAQPIVVAVALFRHDFLGPALWDAPEFRPACQLLQLAPWSLRGRHGAGGHEAWTELVQAELHQRTTRLLDLLVSLSRVSAIDPLSRTTPRAPRNSPMDVVLDELRSMFRDRIRLDELAARVNYSPSGLSRAFRRAYGRSISDELRRLRMNEGARLLVTTAWSIERVAASCGAGTPANFNRQFRHEYGLTPNEYRGRATSVHPLRRAVATPVDDTPRN